jgi:hypothetical protein
MNYANAVTATQLDDGSVLIEFAFDHYATNGTTATGDRVPRPVASVIVEGSAMAPLRRIGLNANDLDRVA